VGALSAPGVSSMRRRWIASQIRATPVLRLVNFFTPSLFISPSYPRPVAVKLEIRDEFAAMSGGGQRPPAVVGRC